MVKTEYPTIVNGKLREDLIRFYSDNNKKIIQVETNVEYDEAIDVYPSKYSYVESENDLIVEEESDEFIVKEESDEFIVKEESEEIIV